MQMKVVIGQSTMKKTIAYHVKRARLAGQGSDIVKNVQLVNNKSILRAVTAYLVNSVQILVPIKMKMKIFNVTHAQRDLAKTTRVNNSVFPALVVHLVPEVKVIVQLVKMTSIDHPVKTVFNVIVVIVDLYRMNKKLRVKHLAINYHPIARKMNI